MANRTFSLSLKKFAEKTNAKVERVIKLTLIDIGGELVLKSPVGNPLLWKNPNAAPPGYVGGRFRANWQYSLNTINNTTYEEKRNREKFGSREAAGMSVNGLFSMGEVFGRHYITNSLPYAIPLEDGHSTQAPSGMVGLTVLEFLPIVEQRAKDVRNGNV